MTRFSTGQGAGRLTFPVWRLLSCLGKRLFNQVVIRHWGISLFSHSQFSQVTG